MLEEGEEAVFSRAWLSDHSTRSIDIQYFIFSMDNVGLIALDYLIRAADRGVKVRMIVDDIMLDVALEDVAALNAHPNIEIRIYNPTEGKNAVQKDRILNLLGVMTLAAREISLCSIRGRTDI